MDQYEAILDNIGKILTVAFFGLIAYLFLFKKASLQKYWNDKNAEMLKKYHNHKS